MIRTVGIAGLGLIGGSLAKAITARTDCRVFGHDIDGSVVSAAMEHGAVTGRLTDAALAECDLIITALYPDDVIAYCKRCFPLMRAGTTVVDCAGVKTRICNELPALAREHSVRFIGGHPMAGVERSGFSGSFAELFDGATMILCRDGNDGVPDELGAFFLSLGFGGIKITAAREHDEVIAYTSQLAHLVSSAYMRSDTAQRRHGFSAGSFKDLTRVARLNENMWAALFLENRDNLLRETDALLEHVRQYRDALASSDFGAVRELLRTGSEMKAADDAAEQNRKR